MAGTAVSVALGGKVTTLTNCAVVVKGRGSGAWRTAVENSDGHRSGTTGSRPELLSRSFSSDYSIPPPNKRTQLSLQTARLASTTTKAVSIPNSAFLGRTELLQREWKSGSRNARRVLRTCPAPAGLPVMAQASFLSQMFDRTCKLLASLLPGKALVETVEAEVDAAASMVHEGAEIVCDIANKVEALANSTESRTDEVERIAAKIVKVMDMIKKNVDDVANVLEGEEGTSVTTLVQSIEQLKTAAADARALATFKNGQEEISEYETTVVLTPSSTVASERTSVSPAGITITRASQIHLSHIVDRTYKRFTTFLPGKAEAEKVEAEVDSAAEMVHEGAEIVSDIANKVETLANTAELRADEVERIAQKIMEVTDKIKKTVDNVAIVVESEDGTSAGILVRSIQQLLHTATADAKNIMEVTDKIKKTVDDVANVLEGEEGTSVSALVQSIKELKKAEADAKTAAAIRECEE